MKLRTRQTLVSLTIILLVMSVFLYAYVGMQTNRLLEAARESGAWQLQAFSEHVLAIERTAVLENEAAQITRQALVQYTFATYAHLLQSAKKAFSLVAEGQYLYNLSAADPMQQLSLTEQTISASQMLRHDGRLTLITGLNLQVYQLPFTLYLTEDISQVEEQINGLTRTSQAALLISLLVCGLLLPPLIRKSLTPLETLSSVADRIAGGSYTLRSGIATRDEVGTLSRSFDRMADTVEDKIRSLEDTNRSQQLLIGALTHELKTPMTAIIGFSDSLLTMPLSEDKRAEALQQIHQAARRTERLSQKMMQLIALGHEEELEKKPVDVRELFEQVSLAAQESVQQAGLSLALDIQPEAGRLLGDADLLHSALSNLVDNAIKASSPGKAITLRASREDQNMVLTVTDQGRGIPQDELPRLTQPFYRVDKARSRKLGGAGLGLALCRLVAQAHGGQLRIESELGQGTMVSLSLPQGETDEKA